MPSTIVLNSNNVVQDGNNNQLVYNFPNSVSFPNHEIAVQSVDMYYSWQNINATPLNNNSFQYTWATQAGLNTYIVTLPNGQYQVSDINAYLQSQMISNGTYLINDNGQNVYYMELILNPTLYSVQLNLFPVPTSLPTGWSFPSNYPVGGLYPTTWVPQFIISPSNNFNLIIGFPQGFSSPSNLTTTTSYTSSQFGLSPEVQPNPCVFLAVSGILNKYAIPNSIIFNVTPNVGFGELINVVPPQFSWNTLLQGNYNQIRIQILGSNYAPIPLLDPNITIVLVIRDVIAELPQELMTIITGSK